MEKTRQYMMEALIEEVVRENKEASLALEYWNNQHATLEEEGKVEEGQTDRIKELQEEKQPKVYKVSERWAVAGAIIVFAIIYLGCYIHQVVSTQPELLPQYPEHYYHYETETIPYMENFPYQFQNLPYELDKYFFDQLANF